MLREHQVPQESRRTIDSDVFGRGRGMLNSGEQTGQLSEKKPSKLTGDRV